MSAGQGLIGSYPSSGAGGRTVCGADGPVGLPRICETLAGMGRAGAEGVCRAGTIWRTISSPGKASRMPPRLL